MLQFWEDSREHNVLSPGHQPMATTGVLQTVQGRHRCDPALVGFTLTTTVPEKTGSILGAWSKLDPDLLSLRAVWKASSESKSAVGNLSSQFNVGKARVCIGIFG